MTQAINNILRQPTVMLLARIVLTSMFWTSGFEKLGDFNGTVAQVQHYGLGMPVLCVLGTLLVQLGGSILVIWNDERWVWIGAGALSVFTVLTIPIAHAFWTLEGKARMADYHLVMEHVSIVGAMALSVAYSQFGRKARGTAEITNAA